MSNYRGDIYQQLIEQIMFPEGRDWYNKETDEYVDYAPQNLSANDRRGASMQASLNEDAMLRDQLQAKYKKGKGDGRPSGIYAGAEFPGMRHQLWQLESGMMPKLGKWDPGESQQEEEARRKKQEEFARFQRQMLGMGGGQPRRNSTILDRRPRFRR